VRSANVRRYLVYQACRHAYFFVPIFFLYFNRAVSVGEVLVLEALYYATVVLLELPSGWFSDRVGRKATLLVSSVMTVGSYAMYCVADDFALLAVAQIGTAAGTAFNSGTDSAFLFDTLASEDRAHEMGAIEGRAQAVGLVSYAAAALVGGAVATIDLRLPYVLAFVAALVGLVAVIGFVEPRAQVHESAPVSHFGAVFGKLRDAAVRWLFAYAIARVVFSHVPYQFFQPWLDLLFRSERLEGSTPLVAGVLLATGKLLAAFASMRAVAMGERLSSGRALVISLGLYLVVIAPMAALLHPAVALAIALRGVPDAIAQPIVAQEIHPRLPSAIRATYLSVESLAGRLAWAGVLLVCAAFAGDFATLDFETLGALLLALGAACAIVTLALAATSRALRSR
jgi:MFS family permease